MTAQQNSDLRRFPQQRIVKTVVFFERQQLLDAQLLGVRLANEKSIDLSAVLLREYRTGRIQQLAARFQQGPQGVENRRLRLGEAPDITLAAQPLDVRMTAHDAGSGAGHVGQDGVKLPA